MSSSLNATDVCACTPRRRHIPVGRCGDPARSIPSTTKGLLVSRILRQCPTDRLFRAGRDRSPVIGAQHSERLAQETPYALACALRIVLIFTGHEVQVLA